MKSQIMLLGEGARRHANLYCVIKNTHRISSMKYGRKGEVMEVVASKGHRYELEYEAGKTIHHCTIDQKKVDILSHEEANVYRLLFK